METNPFTLRENPDTHAIEVRFVVEEGAIAPDADAVRQALSDQKLTDCLIDDNAIAAFVAQCRHAMASIAPPADVSSEILDAPPPPPAEVPAPVEAVIGQRTDGRVEVKVSPDRMTAWLTLVAPSGGKPVPVSEVNAAIKAQGICHGLRIEVLNEVFLTGSCEGRVIAEGTEPAPGVEAHFDSLLDDPNAGREVSQYERIDYREFSSLMLVNPGEPLVRRIPATQGKDGTNVLGQTVPVKPTPDPAFAKGLPGVVADETDPNLLLAAISGQPKIVDYGAVVNPVVDVESVDLSTGNVTFDGTLNVGGDILAGMRAEVAGDVVVAGTIEAAHVVAGGDVIVKGGIVGRADGVTAAVDTARIECKGSLQAKFAEHARIEAGKSISLETAARQCELLAGQDVTVGKGPSQGQIAGGHARALLKVKAGVLGASSGAPTVVQVGFDPRLNTERMNIEAARKRRLEDFVKVRQLLEFLDQNPAKAVGGIREKAEKTREQIETDVAQFDARLAQLAGQLELADGANIEVGKAIYGGVNLQVGQKLLQVLEDRGPARIYFKDGNIILG